MVLLDTVSSSQPQFTKNNFMKNKTSNKKGKIFTKNRVRILQKLIEKLSVCRQEMFEINSKKPNDYLRKMKKYLLCSTCKNYHPQHDDGFSYLDCMLYVKQRDNIKVDYYLIEPSSFHSFLEIIFPSL